MEDNSEIEIKELRSVAIFGFNGVNKFIPLSSPLKLKSLGSFRED